MPQMEEDGPPYARGTETTCRIQAFVTQLGCGCIPMYTAALCIYSFASVRYDFKEERIAWTEKWMHMFIIGASIAFAVIPLVFEFAGPSGKIFRQFYIDLFLISILSASFPFFFHLFTFIYQHSGSWCAALPPCPDDYDMMGCDAGLNWLRFLSITLTTTVSIIVSAIMIVSILFLERRKREENKFLKGKKSLIESYRRMKSTYITIRSTMFLIGTIAVHCFVVISPFLPLTPSFSRTIAYDILLTLSGIINTIVYTSIINRNTEIFNTHEFSLRRSMTGDFNYRKVTGGFRPRKRRSFGSFLIYNSDNFGIYMGDDKEKDEESNGGMNEEKDSCKKPADNCLENASKAPSQNSVFTEEDLSRARRILHRSASDSGVGGKRSTADPNSQDMS